MYILCMNGVVHTLVRLADVRDLRSGLNVEAMLLYVKMERPSVKVSPVLHRSV